MGGAGLLLTFWKVIGRVSGQAGYLHESMFQTKNARKDSKQCKTTSDNTRSNPTGREDWILLVFRKVL